MSILHIRSRRIFQKSYREDIKQKAGARSPGAIDHGSAESDLLLLFYSVMRYTRFAFSVVMRMTSAGCI